MTFKPIFSKEFPITPTNEQLQIINKDAIGNCYFIIPTISPIQVYKTTNSNTQPYEKLEFIIEVDNVDNRSIFNKLFTNPFCQSNEIQSLQSFVCHPIHSTLLQSYCFDDKILFIKTKNQICKVNLVD